MCDIESMITSISPLLAAVAAVAAAVAAFKANEISGALDVPPSSVAPAFGVQYPNSGDWT